MHHQRTNIIITPHQHPPARTEGNIRDGFKPCTRVCATPAMVNPRVNPLGLRAQGMKLSLLFSFLLANQSQPQNNTPFARHLKYDSALSISASSSTARFARRLRQFPLEAAPRVIPNRPAGRQTNAQARKHAEKPSPGQEASEGRQAGQHAGRQ